MQNCVPRPSGWLITHQLTDYRYTILALKAGFQPIAGVVTVISDLQRSADVEKLMKRQVRSG
jgi:hypothetical protein